MGIFKILCITIVLLFYCKSAFSQSDSQLDSLCIRPIPLQFKFIDFNSDGKITQEEIDFIVISKLDNAAKYPKSLLDEFVNYLMVYKINPTKADSIYNPKLKIEKSILKLDTNEFGSIITDRPDQTEASSLTPRGWFQIESGTWIEYDNKADYNTVNTTYVTNLIKYGLSKQFELRLIVESGKSVTKFKSSSIPDQNATGLYPIKIGSKIKICDEYKWIPAISLISHLELPDFGSNDFKTNYTIPQFRFTFAHSITDNIAFSYNAGAEWEDGISNATYIYTASLAFSFLERMGLFIESYGFLKEKVLPDHRLDAGITGQLTNNLQLDVSGGIGISPISPSSFISAGISWRFNAFDKTRRFQGQLKKQP